MQAGVQSLTSQSETARETHWSIFLTSETTTSLLILPQLVVANVLRVLHLSARLSLPNLVLTTKPYHNASESENIDRQRHPSGCRGQRQGHPYQGDDGGEGRHPSSTATIDFQWFSVERRDHHRRIWHPGWCLIAFGLDPKRRPLTTLGPSIDPICASDIV